MENDFKPAYEKIKNPDGSVEYQFKSKRIGVQHGIAPFLLALIVLWPASCAVTSPVVMTAGKGGEAGFIVLWNLLAIALLFFVLYKFNTVQDSVRVLPHQGLSFCGKSLPSEAIESIGTMVFSTGANPTGTAYVYATSKGKQIQITKNMDSVLAASLKDEFLKTLNGG